MKTEHTINNPLVLIWKPEDQVYKVNKPNEGTQELVSKEVATELLEALKSVLFEVKMGRATLDKTGGYATLTQIQEAITKATL